MQTLANKLALAPIASTGLRTQELQCFLAQLATQHSKVKDRSHLNLQLTI